MARGGSHLRAWPPRDRPPLAAARHRRAACYHVADDPVPGPRAATGQRAPRPRRSPRRARRQRRPCSGAPTVKALRRILSRVAHPGADQEQPPGGPASGGPVRRRHHHHRHHRLGTPRCPRRAPANADGEAGGVAGGAAVAPPARPTAPGPGPKPPRRDRSSALRPRTPHGPRRRPPARPAAGTAAAGRTTARERPGSRPR